MITYKDIELLENLKKSIYLPEGNNDTKDIISSEIDLTNTMFIFSSLDQDETIEKKNRIIEDLNKFIKKHPEYSYDYQMNFGNEQTSVAFTIRNKKNNGITKTNNTLN